MNCPYCKNPCHIKGSRYVIRKDKLYLVQDLICRNPMCDHRHQVVDVIEHEIENVTVE